MYLKNLARWPIRATPALNKDQGQRWAIQNRLGDLLNATDSHTRRLLQINTWGPSSSFVFRGPIMAKIDPASAPIFNIRSICARISPCPNNDIAPQLCNWRENISTINQPKGSDIGVESKTGQRPSSATSKSSMDRYCSLNTLWARLMVQHFTLWVLEHLIPVGLTRKVETLIRDKFASSSAADLSSLPFLNRAFFHGLEYLLTRYSKYNRTCRDSLQKIYKVFRTIFNLNLQLVNVQWEQ